MDAVQAFADLVMQPDDEIDLARAAAMVALREYPDLELDAIGLALDELAAGVHDFSTLHDRLFVQLGFTGDSDDYYQPDNSYLHRVVERRRGIPITLSLVAFEVARRAAVPLEPIGMPGHFLVRDPVSGIYADCFNGGRLMDERGCEALFRAATGAGDEVPFGAFLLPVFGRAQVLERILANLILVHRVAADAPALEWFLRLRLALPEVTEDDIIGLAEAVAEQGRTREAAAELESWATVSPELNAPLTAAARRLLAKLN